MPFLIFVFCRTKYNRSLQSLLMSLNFSTRVYDVYIQIIEFIMDDGTVLGNGLTVRTYVSQ